MRKSGKEKISADLSQQKVKHTKQRPGPDWSYERSLSNGTKVVAGVDEVGRGCLAGPVYAAAVVLSSQEDIWAGLNDSKKLSKRKREQLHAFIHEHAVGVGIGVASVAEIDELNILHASRLAMARAVTELAAKLQMPMDLLLVDGTYEPLWQSAPSVTSQTVIDGDARCPSIAAASIVAKVERDFAMAELAETYPMYGFERNAGYGTPEHRNALREHGPTSYHRQSFAPVAQYAQLELDLRGS